MIALVAVRQRRLAIFGGALEAHRAPAAQLTRLGDPFVREALIGAVALVVRVARAPDLEVVPLVEVAPDTRDDEEDG